MTFGEKVTLIGFLKKVAVFFIRPILTPLLLILLFQYSARSHPGERGSQPGKPLACIKSIADDESLISIIDYKIQMMKIPKSQMIHDSEKKARYRVFIEYCVFEYILDFGSTSVCNLPSVSVCVQQNFQTFQSVYIQNPIRLFYFRSYCVTFFN